MNVSDIDHIFDAFGLFLLAGIFIYSEMSFPPKIRCVT